MADFMLCAHHGNKYFGMNKPGRSICYNLIKNLNIESIYMLGHASRLSRVCLRHVDGDPVYGTFTRRYSLFDDNMIKIHSIPQHAISIWLNAHVDLCTKHRDHPDLLGMSGKENL